MSHKPKIVLVCGNRKWLNRSLIESKLIRFYKDTKIIHGGATGADSLAGSIAEHLGYKVTVFRADWEAHGCAAGPIRNRKMLDTKPDLVLAFYHGPCKGTADCVAEAMRRGIPVELVCVT